MIKDFLSFSIISSGEPQFRVCWLEIDANTRTIRVTARRAEKGKVASDTKEADQLVEDGFAYVTGEYNDGGKIFRNPK